MSEASVGAPFPPPIMEIPPPPRRIEATPAKERVVDQKRQVEEVKIIGSIGVERMLQKVETKLEGKNESERAEILKNEPEYIRNLRWAKDPIAPQQFEGQPIPLKIKLKDGSEAIVLETFGRESAGEGAVRCKIAKIGLGGNEISRSGTAETPIMVDASDIFQGMIVANSGELIPALPTDQREATKLYISYLQKGEAAFEGIDAGSLNEIIDKTGDSLGLITSGDLEMFIQNYYKQLGTEAGAQGNVLDSKMKDLLDNLQTKGVNLADPETISTLLIETGALGPEQLSPLFTQINAEMDQLTQQLKSSSKAESETVRDQISQLRTHKKLLELAREGLKSENIEKLFANMESGAVSEAAMRNNKNAIRSADPTQILDAALMADTDLAKQAAKELKKEDREKFLKKIGKTGGFAALAMMIMMYTAMKGGDKAQ